MNLLRRLRSLFRRRDVEAEMAEEMRFHLEQRAADYAADGLAPDDARLAAQRKFGNTAALQEHARDSFGWGALERLGKDLAFAARQLRRAPGFSLLAIVTLGLGIGANTSMFCVLSGIRLKPLPYADIDHLQHVHRVTPQNRSGNHSPADFIALQKSAASYGTVAAVASGRVSLSDPGQHAQLALGARASTNLLSLLGVSVQLGRDFLPGEDAPGRNRVVILSQRTWRNRYGAAPDILGRKIRIDGEPHEVVGVLPPSFNDWRHLGNIDFFRPFELTTAFAANRQSNELHIFGRFSPALSAADAAAWMANFGEQLAREFPDANGASTWRATSMQATVVGTTGGTTLPLLVGLSGFVLLIACSNLANLLLARTMARAREFAVRGALGASRLQLLRPLVAEALLLSLAGGVLAIVVALWFRDWAAMRSTGDNGEQVVFAIDWKILAWTFGASCLTALAFGLAPALFALRLDLNDTLKSGGRGATGGRGQQRFRQLLIVAQFALATVLLAGAAMFIRGLNDLHHRRSGWESARVVTGQVALPSGAYGDPAKIVAFQRLALERLHATPGVESATLASAAPFFDWPVVAKFIVEGRDRPAAGREPAAMVNSLSPRYLETFGMRLVAGRAFTERDNATAPRVFLVGQTTARAFFGEVDPIGRRVALIENGAPQWGEIVGVVADFESVDPEPAPIAHRLYQPLEQAPPRNFEIAVRAQAAASPAGLVDSIRSALASIDADLPIRRLQPADANIDRTLYQMRVLRDMLGAFGALGLALASLGIYGVIARTMAQRTNEFAIRLALGASVRDITRLVLGSGVRLALLGSGLGLLGAIGVTRLLLSGFPGIRANPVLILTATTLLLVTVALVACWLPARRAAKVDAMLALRAE
ncbi:MAG: ABC transporter permease [Opitutae bacterium]|nr:ABC transporter permease [Opitutae bacterium]